MDILPTNPPHDPDAATAGFTPQSLAVALDRLERQVGVAPSGLCIALSGGVDSMALLHAAAAVAPARGRSLRAIHVDHGLQAQAGAWAALCREACAAMGVPLEVITLELSPPRGASVEAFARSARYAAFAEALAPGEWLLTAQHQDDQFETVLLQLLRGAGVSGLAAMPAVARLGRGWHLRPLLDVRRAALEAYASRAGLRWVEDPMNSDTRYDRAYLRRELSPRFAARWPAAARTVSRSAAHLADAQSILTDVAVADAQHAVDDDGRLEIEALLVLSPARQRNLLRHWIERRGLGLPNSARLEAILTDQATARAGSNPVVSWPSGEVRRYRGRLYAMQPLGAEPKGTWRLAPGETLAIPGAGTVRLVESVGEGIDRERFPGPFELRFRRGGERFRVVGQAFSKPLQQWFQESGVEPWLRSRVPWLDSGQTLLAVGNYWVAAEAAAAAGTRGHRLAWNPDVAGVASR